MKIIELTQGKVAFVDDSDFETLSQYQWYAFKSGKGFYAARNIKIANGEQRRRSMHRDILNIKSVFINVDHVNHNGLDNRRTNLRICTSQQNAQNRRKGQGCASLLKGVSFRKDTGRWRARIVYQGKRIHLGNFNLEHDAASAYAQAAKKYYGSFACTDHV